MTPLINVTSCSYANDNAPITFPVVGATPTSQPPSLIQLNDTNTCKTINITVEKRIPEPTRRILHNAQQYNDANMHAAGFKTSRRKKILSNLIGNSDTFINVY